jgi:hypothetical protein
MEQIKAPYNHHHKSEKKVNGQKLLSSEVSERVILKLDKTIKSSDGGVNGVIWFGQNNDYPQLIEKLINGSPSAKMVANVYAKFLTGEGFENEVINNIVVGKDPRGKQITVLSLLRQVAISVSKHSGFYIHCNLKQNIKIKNVHLKPFKDCRFSKPDDTGFSAKILVYDNWLKDSELKKYDPKQVKDFHIFNLDPKVFIEQVKKSKGIENYKGQIYFQFFDDEYFYPLSNFDPVYLDCDTDSQISLYRNRQIRDGFFKKTVIRTSPAGTEEQKREFAEDLRRQLGPNGENVIVIEEDIGDNGEISDQTAYKIDQIDTNVDDKLFENWDKSISNNIRKAGGKGIPAILIDYEEGKLSSTSGESIIQACNYFNSIILDDQKLLSNSFKEIFSNFDNPILENNTNWNIKSLQLNVKEQSVQVDETKIARLQAQSTLKGSVGGVQALLQIQTSVGLGTTDLEAAVVMVMEIYGFDEITARKIVGTPKIQQNGITNNPTTTGN